MAGNFTAEQQQKIDLLLEAERRGILSQRPDKQAVLDEMRSRGILDPDPFSQADTSPIEFDELANKRKFTRPTGPNVPAVVDVEGLNLARARAATGIVEKEVKGMTGFKLGLSANPQQEIQRLIQDDVGKNVPIRFSPETNTYQIVDPSDNRIKNIQIATGPKVAAESPVIVGDIVGTVAGGIAAGRVGVSPLTGEVAGSTSGVFIGEMARLVTGQLMGVNQDMSVNDMAAHAARKAGIAGGITGAAGKFLQLAKGVTNFLKGRTGTEDALLRSELTSEEANIAINKVAGILREKGPIRPEDAPLLTVAKKSGDDILLSHEAKLRTEIDFAPQFLQRDREDLAKITRAYDEITPTEGTAGNAIRLANRTRTGRLDRAQEAVDTSRANLESSLKELDATAVGDTGGITRKVIDQKRILAENHLKRTHSQWKKLAGANPSQTASQIKIPMGGNTRAVLGTLNQESKNALLKFSQTAREGIFSRGFLKNKQADLMDIQRAISDIKAVLRAKDKGESVVSDAQVRVLKRLIKPLQKDRDLWLSKNSRDDLLFAIKAADTETSLTRDMLDRSMAGTLMEKSAGRFKVRSQDIFNKGFVKHGKEQSEEIVRVIGDNPEAMGAWRAEILNKYRTEVLDEAGVPNKKKHDKFMADYRAPMEPYFSKQEMKRMDRTGGLVRVVEEKEQVMANKLKALNAPQTGTGKVLKQLDNMDPEQVAPWIITNRHAAPGRARRVVKLLRNNPRELEGIRADTRKNLSADAKVGGMLDPAKFNANITRNEKAYRELLGDQYVDDLFAINTVLQKWTEKGRVLARPELEEVAVQVARATKFAPLTREGRALTAALKFRTRVGRQRIAAALLSGDELHQLAKDAKLMDSSREAFELAASLGYIGLEE